MQGFISYSRDDVEMMRQFRIHLSGTERAFGVTCWVDEHLHAGLNFDAVVKSKIAEARVFILLLSPSFLHSDYIRETELPAIIARVNATDGLLCPVLLLECGWQRFAEFTDSIPKGDDNRIKAIAEWTIVSNGYNAARVQIEAALRGKLKLTPKERSLSSLLADKQDEKPGPIWRPQQDELDAILPGSDADVAAVNTPAMLGLHAPNAAKAKQLSERVGRIANSIDKRWEDLITTAASLADILNCPTTALPDRILALWNASVDIGSMLAYDNALRKARSTDPDPLPEDVHHLLERLVTTLAPWLREFDTARKLDDARGAFMASTDLLEPAFHSIARARDKGLITEAAAKMMRGQAATVRRDGRQGEKAGSFSIRAAHNLFAEIGRIIEKQRATGSPPNDPAQAAILQRAVEYLKDPDDKILALIASFPPDYREALDELLRHADEPGFPFSGAVSLGLRRIPRLTRFARWRDPIPGLPSFPSHEMITLGGPGERFMMGAAPNEVDARPNEHPQHLVTVPFFGLAIDAVTFAQWDAARAGGADLPDPDPEGWGRDDRPVINVSWEDAQAYCAWLNGQLQLTGFDRYRLPTEAEWEYACRAGTVDPFSFGATISTDEVNYDGNYTYGRGRKGKYRKQTIPVGELLANQWGLRQMHGNVWEWVEDSYVDSYAGAQPDASLAIHNDNATSRVLRGGSWSLNPQICRAATRFRSAPGIRSNSFGFRVARTPGRLPGLHPGS